MTRFSHTGEARGLPGLTLAAIAAIGPFCFRFSLELRFFAWIWSECLSLRFGLIFLANQFPVLSSRFSVRFAVCSPHA